MCLFNTRLETRNSKTVLLRPSARPKLPFFDLVGVVGPLRGMGRSRSWLCEEFLFAAGELSDELVRNAFESEKLGHSHDLRGAFHAHSAYARLVDGLADGDDAVTFDHLIITAGAWSRVRARSAPS